MRVVELIAPKGFRNPWRANGTHQKDSVDKENVITTMKALHMNNRPPAAILSAIRQMFGPDALAFARTHLGGICMEAISVAPLHKEQLDELKNILQQPIAAEEAVERLQGILEDDGLNESFDFAVDKDDVREIIMHWLSLHMPQLVHSPDERDMMGHGEGHFSPLHGYGDEDYIDQENELGL